MKNLTIIIISLFFTCCTGNYINEWSDGDYYVQDLHGTGNFELYLRINSKGGIGRISRIKEIGCNSGYIIAINSSNEYYILNREEDNKFFNASDIVEGPMDSLEFDRKRTKYNILDIKFEYEF